MVYVNTSPFSLYDIIVPPPQNIHTLTRTHTIKKRDVQCLQIQRKQVKSDIHFKIKDNFLKKTVLCAC